MKRQRRSRNLICEKGYLLIAVTPEKLEVVSVKKGVTGDSVYWNPPTVTFRKN
jgi:hypothetical protein